MNRCPPGLHFDDISKLCLFKNEARCGPLPTSVYFLIISISIALLLMLWAKCLTLVNEIIVLIAPAPVTEPPTNLAERCDTSKCQLPYCFCSRDGTIIPGGFRPEEVS